MPALIGRVSQTRAGDDIILSIPSKKSWKIVFFCGWLAFWIFVPLSMLLRAVYSLKGPGPTDWFTLLWGIAWIFGIAAVVWAILWGIGGNELLRMSPSSIEITTTLFGIVVRRRCTPASELRNPRYVPAYSTSARRSRESCICYEDSAGTAKFGADLDDAEALAVIDQMLSLYPFPKKDKAYEYIDLNG